MIAKMKKLKIATFIGTRPEIIRLSCIIRKLDIFCNHVLVHTGQNYDYELSQIFFDELKIRKPDYFLNAAGRNSAQTIGNVISFADEALEKIRPDAVLVLGDTNSCMALISAKKRKIPTFHMEAGNRCFDLRVPEEINRKIADHTADINLTYSKIARSYLLREGLDPDLCIKVGSPMLEVINENFSSIENSMILDSLNLKMNQYFLISAHREENIENDINFKKFLNIIYEIDRKYNLPIIISTHPRTQKRLDSYKIKFGENIRILKPLGYFDYNHLQIKSRAVLSDSGTISEESSILNFPALNIREAHERPEAMEEASVMMVGLEVERVFQGLDILEAQSRGVKRTLNRVVDYGSNNVSDKIVRLIHSYTDYVNRVVWKNL